MALVTGNQLKAARALAEIDQQQLAKAGEVNVNTIRNMEARGGEPITSGALTVRNVQLALEAYGIEFLDHGEPGVRLRKRPIEPVGESKSAGATPTADTKKKTRRRTPGKRSGTSGRR